MNTGADNFLKMAVVDPQDLHLHGIRRRSTEDSVLSVLLLIELILDIVSKVLMHWWHLKFGKYLSLYRSFVLRNLRNIPLIKRNHKILSIPKIL